jgi:hypothetical protein
MADITIATTLAAHVSVGTPAILIATVSHPGPDSARSTH